MNTTSGGLRKMTVFPFGIPNSTPQKEGGRRKADDLTQSKLKRQASSPLVDCAIDNLTEGHANKIPRPDQPCDSFSNSTQQQAQQQNQQTQQPGIPNFSVQIVQQYNTSTPSQASLSQTVQTNVTVQGMNGGLIKASNSPLAPTAVSTASPGCTASGAATADSGNQLSNSISNNSGVSNAASVSANIECKQEPDTEFPQCSVKGTLPELNNELTSANNDVNTTTTSSAAATTGDRFSDSLANLGFPEDSNDEVIHPDLLKDIIDDVFTNPSDLMNGFCFVESLDLKDNTQSLDDDKDSLRPMMSLNKPVQDSPPSHFQNPANSPNLFPMNQTQQNVFDFPSGNTNSTSQTLPNNSNSVQPSFTSSRIGSYTATSPSMPGIPNNGLGLDFKLTEPSPAAQTLKQMAEQHQNMQHKQQLGLGVSPRSPFGSDSFPDPLSNIRTNFLNGSPNSMNSLQKSPTGMFQPMGFPQQQAFSTPSSSVVKQEVITPNTPIYPSNINPHLPDIEMHKRRQQAMQMQQNQMANINGPPFSHSPDQKRQFPGMRQLPIYNDPSPGHPPNDGSASNSPVTHHPPQFMRSVSTPGVTPPPSQGFVSSPSPSAGVMHLSQSHQMQHNANNQQQLQMAQSQLIMNQDLKPVISTQQQQMQQQHLQHQHIQSRLFYSGQPSVHMSQPQSIGFQFPCSTRSGSPTTTQRPSTIAQANSTQRQMQQLYMTRPPPDYQATVEPNSSGISLQSGVLSQGAQMHMNISENINLCNDQSNRNIELRNINVSKSFAGMISTSQTASISSCQSYSSIVPVSNTYPGVIPHSNASTLSKPYPGMLSVSDGASVAGSKSYPSVITLDDTIRSPNNMPVSASRPFAGLNQNSNSISITVSKSVQDTIAFPNASVPTGKSYSSNVSVPNNTPASKAYQRRMVNTNLPASQPYAVASSVGLQGQSQMMPVTTMAPTYITNKGRVAGKQVASRRGRQCGPLYRAQKPPNVNVGPEGLNISQRPPAMSTDWRQAYVQQNQPQIPNIHIQMRLAYPRQAVQNFGQNVGNGNNYQSHHINPNSPASNNSLLSISSNTDSALPRQGGIPEIGSVTSHLSLHQPPQVVMGSDNSMLCSSQLHMATSIASPGESMNQVHQQVFSPSTSSNGSSQNIVPDSSNFNLDFLDNLDCSTSDLLNFDVMHGESTSFPLLEDISILDK
ncbi:uncharacterized protein TNCT_32101 [Trichonephila clavata]|uniref:Uncharacterized protein n=1 Tax=Trichonephila clavata TaxID=2740835 RepID=A0A8X6GL59_TRICU|nr:uncharacterized protein TNCT_32101 [Trichonephila clavata]